MPKRLALLMGALGAIVLLGGCGPATVADPAHPYAGTSAEQGSRCAAAGGDWRRFTNGCRDRCGPVRALKRRDPERRVVCTMDTPMGCDCGPDRCWTGQACEPN